MFYTVVVMKIELRERAQHQADRAAAALYHLLFRLARRLAVDPPVEPDPGVMPDPLVVLMAVEAARRNMWM
jgi:hypothetical protein